MTDRCTSWLGHRFVARYTTEAVKFGSDELNALALINRNENRTYERDVCVRCGATIEKSTAERQKR